MDGSGSSRSYNLATNKNISNDITWKENKHFKHLNIMKIDCTLDRYYYLDSNGTLWTNQHGDELFKAPYKIPSYFDDTRFVDFACERWRLALCIDDKGVNSEDFF